MMVSMDCIEYVEMVGLNSAHSCAQCVHEVANMYELVSVCSEYVSTLL